MTTATKTDSEVFAELVEKADITPQCEHPHHSKGCCGCEPTEPAAYIVRAMHVDTDCDKPLTMMWCAAVTNQTLADTRPHKCYKGHMTRDLREWFTVVGEV